MTFFDTEASRDSASPRELYLFTQGDREWAWTGADADVSWFGRVYAKTGIARTAIDFSQEDTAGNIDIIVPAINEVAQLFVGLPPSPQVYVTVTRVHRDGRSGIMFVGRVSRPTFTEDLEARLTCVPLPGALSRPIPSLTYQRQCNWALYGADCGISAAAFRDAATLSVVSGYVIRSSTFSSHPDGWYTGGWAELTSGTRAGDKRGITKHVGDELTLTAPFQGVVPGDTVYAFAGCDRTETTCKNKFNNLERHMGFNRIPDKNPHQGRMS